ncbi:olfactory receptor 8G17-like [Gastrophryne carolinensis]
MRNETFLSELFLLGLSDLPSLQLPLFLFFLLIYLLTLTWNLLIIIFIVVDSHLHTPMYFFLGNLASLDLCASSVTIPRMLFDLHTQRRIISVTACITQFFFFLFFAFSEVLLLAIMSYDRYVAICHPLHYMQIMGWRQCVQLACSVWTIGLTHSILHTSFVLKLTFCRSGIIESFFCDLPKLLQISCSDVFINVLLILFFAVFFGIMFLTVTIVPYVYIFKTVLKLQVKGSRSKVFATCSSHLTVVLIFYISAWLNYFTLGAKIHFAGDKAVSVIYSVVPSLLNPLIYSLRNQDFKAAFRNVSQR